MTAGRDLDDATAIETAGPPSSDPAPGPSPLARHGAGARIRLRPFDPRLIGRTRSVRWVLGADVGAGLVGTLLLLAQVTVLATLIADAATGAIDAVPTASIVVLAAVVIARGGLAHAVELTGRRAASTVMSGLRAELITARLHRPVAPADTVDRGELAVAAVQGVDGLETYFARYLPQVVLAVLVPIAVLVWTAFVDLTSAVIMVVTLPVIPVFLVLIGRSAASRSRANWEALVALSAHFLDVVTGLPTLRGFNRGRAQIPKITDAADAYRRATMGTLRLAFLSGVVLDLATSLSTALVAVTLGVRLVEGNVELRPALVVLLLVPELFAPIRQVGSLFHASTDGLAGAERILDILDQPAPGPDRPGSPRAVSSRPADGADATIASPPARPGPEDGDVLVRLAGVTVRYPQRSVPALDHVDLELHRGELVVVMGASGAGKSTLAAVVLGLVTPDDGTVEVSGRILDPVTADAWRHHLGWAPQRPTLVHGTVADNIALGRADASRAEVVAAAAAAGADGFIGDLPDGYDTVIGDGGRGLSAGQRQRLGLARAFLRDAALLVVDEPTAHLDPVSAAVVAATLTERRGERTTIVLTHDPDLVPDADRVVHLADGRWTDPTEASP